MQMISRIATICASIRFSNPLDSAETTCSNVTNACMFFSSAVSRALLEAMVRVVSIFASFASRTLLGHKASQPKDNRI